MNLRRHLSYANVVSTICLFLALGGVAYAGTKLAKGSVGVNQLKAEAVTKPKLHANSVNSKKVVDGSLTGADIASSTLGKVPAADHADSADSATHAAEADKAADAERLDGRSPSEFGPVLVASSPTELTLEAERYFSVSGFFAGELEARKVALTLPGRKFKATDFAVRLEGEAQAEAGVHVSLVVNGAAQDVCTLTAVPSTCAPSTAVEIPAGAQVAWKTETAAPIKARPEFALRLLPG